MNVQVCKDMHSGEKSPLFISMQTCRSKAGYRKGERSEIYAINNFSFLRGSQFRRDKKE